MFCKNCGREISNDTKFCPGCGTNQNVVIEVNPLYENRFSGDIANPSKKKKKKWWIAIIVIVAVFLFFWLIGITDDDSTPTAGNDISQTKITASRNEKPEGTIGNYIVTIKDSRVTTDPSGNDILIVTYSYTNNSDEAKAMHYTISDKLFQNGVELGDVWSSYGIDGYSFDNETKEIKPGITLDVQIAYKLNDTTTDVDVEIYDYWEHLEPVTYTISLK